MKASLGLSTGSLFASITNISGNVLIHIQTKEMSTTATDTSDMILAGRLDCGFCTKQILLKSYLFACVACRRSQRARWYGTKAPTPKSSGSSSSSCWFCLATSLSIASRRDINWAQTVRMSKQSFGPGYAGYRQVSL